MTVYGEVLRAQLNKYKGVEMQADGDAVLLGFRDPVSAVAWALATQQVCFNRGQSVFVGMQCRSMETLLLVLPAVHTVAANQGCFELYCYAYVDFASTLMLIRVLIACLSRDELAATQIEIEQVPSSLGWRLVFVLDTSH